MGKDDAYWLRICYVIFGVILAFAFYNAAVTLGIQNNWIERYDEWYEYVSILCSIVLAGGLTFYSTKNRERHDYFLASIGELRKVTWPSFIDTRRMTIVVVVVVGIFAVILAAFDFVWSKVLSLMLA